jgi:hypothetical protein
MFTSRNTTTPSATEAVHVVPDDVVDAAFALYLDWRRQSSACESAYRHWTTTAHTRESALAFAAYTAALDREEQAAAQYENAIARG